MRLIANFVSIMLIAVLVLVLQAPGDTAASEVNVPSAGAHPSKFLTPDGRFDLEAARRSGFEGTLDLDGFNVRFDPETGGPLLSPAGFRSVEADPDDIYWAEGFELPIPGMDDDVHALAIYDGMLVAAGKFTTAGGVSANRIAAWNGATWSPLGTGMDDVVYALTVYGNKLIAGGYFSTAGGVSAVAIASWEKRCVPSMRSRDSSNKFDSGSGVFIWDRSVVCPGLFPVHGAAAVCSRG